MPFQKGRSGNPKGRPVGAKDRIPRSFRKIVQEFLAEHHGDVAKALLRGVNDRHQSIKALAVLASLERQQVELTGADGGPIEVHDHFALPPDR